MIATAVSQTRIDLSWTDNASDEFAYHIERSPDGSSSWSEIGTVGPDIATYSDSGLTCATTYYYRVRAYRSSDGLFSLYSNAAHATAITCPQFSIDDMTVTEGHSSTVSTEFTVSLSNGSSQEATVDWTTADGTALAGNDYTAASGTLTFSPGDPLTQTVSVLVLGDTIDELDETFKVNLSNATNATILDGQGLGTILDDDLTGPSNLTATALSQTEISLGWMDPNSSETAYHIERSPDGTTWGEIGTVGANQNIYLDSDLTCGTTCYYRVRAYRSSDDEHSPYSNTANATTQACPLAAPSGLTATVISQTQIDLSWTDNSERRDQLPHRALAGRCYRLEPDRHGGGQRHQLPEPRADLRDALLLPRACLPER